MRIVRGLTLSGALVSMLAGVAGAQDYDRSAVRDIVRERQAAPAVDLWLDQATYEFGDRIRPYFASEHGAYVTVVRVTTDGELRVLYPRRPTEQRQYDQARLVNDQIPYSGDRAFHLTESRGMGFVFAIASYERFDFRYYSTGSQWNTARLATSRYGDPFAIVNNFIARTLSTYADFSLDYVAYELYSDRDRSRYANRYAGYYGSDYYDLCVSAFGIRHNYYCQSYGVAYYGPGYYGSGHYWPGYYGNAYGGPVIIGRPQTPGSPSGPRPRLGMRPKPLVRDPVVPSVPLEPVPVEGRFPSNDRAERAATERRAAEVRARAHGKEWPRMETQPRINVRPAPRAEPSRPMPSEPRVYVRPEPRSEPRYVPPTPARVEVRNEPRAQPAPQRIERSVERPQVRQNAPPPEKQ